MRNKIALMGILVGLLSGCSMLPKGKTQQGALQVTSNGAFSVYLDDTFLGQTPFFDEKIGAGEYLVRLVPGSDGAEGIWQNQVGISSGALTVVHYEWGGSSETSNSEVLELEKLADSESVGLSLSTLPDSVVVKLDGELKGFSPVAFDDISEGDHVLSLESPGFKSKTINLKTSRGFRLNVTVNLARDPDLILSPLGQDETSATESGVVVETPVSDVAPTPSVTAKPSPTPSPTPQTGFGSVVGGISNGETSSAKLSKPYVLILETGTGWLRVRAEAAGLVSNEVAKAKVGTYFPFVGRSEDGEWVEIEYSTGKTGWVSNAYVRITE